MFTILLKNVDGRISHRYFKSYKKAEKAMMKDVKDCAEHNELIGSWTIARMNTSKGFYEREETILAKGGIRFHWALIDGYFEDDLID